VGQSSAVKVSIPRTAGIFSDQEGTIGEVARWQLKNHPLGELVNDTL